MTRHTVWLVLLILLLVLPDCSKKILQSDEDVATYRLLNVETRFIFDTIRGNQLMIINGNDRAIGIFFSDNSNRSEVIYSDSWLGGGKSVAQAASFDDGQEIYLRVVVYRSLSDAIRVFIESLGPDFFGQLNDVWIEDVDEAVFTLERTS